MLPQKRATHKYVLSVQDWCYNTATLNVTIVTENTVSINQGNTEAHGGQKRVVRHKFNSYIYIISTVSLLADYMLCVPFGFIVPKTLSYLTFRLSDFNGT